MATLNQQIKELQSTAGLISTIRAYAKTDGGHLTEFGKNFVHICVNAEMSQSTIAKILDVTSAAVSQNAAKLK